MADTKPSLRRGIPRGDIPWYPKVTSSSSYDSKNSSRPRSHAQVAVSVPVAQEATAGDVLVTEDVRDETLARGAQLAFDSAGRLTLKGFRRTRPPVRGCPSGAVIELERVTPANYAETLALSVCPAQERLIASVVKSLADAFVWNADVRVAREGDCLVGFVMMYAFERDGEPIVNVVRFMIDQRHQGRGLGRIMMAKTLDWISAFDPPPRRVRISTSPENMRALRLYRSAGFEGSEIEDGEVVLWLDPVRPGNRANRSPDRRMNRM